MAIRFMPSLRRLIARERPADREGAVEELAAARAAMDALKERIEALKILEAEGELIRLPDTTPNNRSGTPC